jgi:hypothetical protein
MELARDVLREAESWSTLESKMSSLLSEQNYEKTTEKFSEANKSMVIFQNTPEYEARRALMVSLQNQLEASLSSALIAAINSHDIALCSTTTLSSPISSATLRLERTTLAHGGAHWLARGKLRNLLTLVFRHPSSTNNPFPTSLIFSPQRPCRP